MISPGFQEDFLDLVNGVYHVLYMLLRYVFHLLTEPALEMIHIDIIIVISQIRLGYSFSAIQESFVHFKMLFNSFSIP